MSFKNFGSQIGCYDNVAYLKLVEKFTLASASWGYQHAFEATQEDCINNFYASCKEIQHIIHERHFDKPSIMNKLDHMHSELIRYITSQADPFTIIYPNLNAKSLNSYVDSLATSFRNILASGIIHRWSTYEKLEECDRYMQKNRSYGTLPNINKFLRDAGDYYLDFDEKVKKGIDLNMDKNLNPYEKELGKDLKASSNLVNEAFDFLPGVMGKTDKTNKKDNKKDNKKTEPLFNIKTDTKPQADTDVKIDKDKNEVLEDAIKKYTKDIKVTEVTDKK